MNRPEAVPCEHDDTEADDELDQRLLTPNQPHQQTKHHQRDDDLTTTPASVCGDHRSPTVEAGTALNWCHACDVWRLDRASLPTIRAGGSGTSRWRTHRR